MRTWLIFFLLCLSGRVYAQEQSKYWESQPLDSLAENLEKLLLKDLDSTLLVSVGVIKRAETERNRYIQAKVRRIHISSLWLLGNYETAQDSIRNSLSLIQGWIREIEDTDEKERMELLEVAVSNEQGRIYSRLGKHKEAVDVFLSNINKLETKTQTKYIKLRIAAFTANVAVSYKLMGKKLDSAILMYRKSLLIFEEVGDPYYTSNIYLNLGIALKEKGNYSEALKLHHKGYDLATENDYHFQGNFLLGLISLYTKFKDYFSSIRYGKKCLSLAESRNNLPLKAHVSVALGASYLDKQQLDSALYYFESSLDISKGLEDVLGQGDAYQLIAKTYIRQEKYNKALTYIDQGFAIMNDHSDRFIELQLSLWRAKCMLELGNIETAINSIQKTIELVNYTGNKIHKRNTYEIAHEIYAKAGNASRAYQYLNQYSSYQDSVLTEERTLEIARIEFDHQLKIETERLELEKKQQAEIYNAQLEKERLIQQATLGGGLLSLLVLIMVYRSYQIKKQKNKELATKNVEINQLRETEKKMAQETIALKERELTTFTMLSHERNSLLQHLGNQIGNLTSKVDDEVIPDLRDIKRTISSNLSEETWSNFMYQFEKVHPQFFNELKRQFPKLTHHDLRICAYLRVGMEKKEIAMVSNTTSEAVKKSLYRLKKKMDLTGNDDLRAFLMKI